MSELTRDGEIKVARWLTAAAAVTELERKLAAARSELDCAEQDLGAWLVPRDAAAGEVFCVWHGDSLLQCRVVVAPYGPGRGTYHVSVRTRGKTLIQAETEALVSAQREVV